MIYAEAAYFAGAHVAHIAAWEDRQRRQRIWADHERIARTNARKETRA